MRYDIRRCRMIYLRCKYDIRTRPAGEIKDFERVPRNLVIRFAHNNIRSFICRRHISSSEGGYHIEDISPVPQGTDIIKKSHLCRKTKVTFFMELVTGIEPATCSLRMSCSAIEPHQQIYRKWYYNTNVTGFQEVISTFRKSLLFY